MVGVADRGEGLHATTAFNLGSPRAEKGPFKNDTCVMLVALLCSGATSWSLMVVDYPWTWIKILAIPVLHVCLLIMLAVPLCNERQVGRPYHYCKFNAIEALIRTRGITGRTSNTTCRFLQVTTKSGDVIHFQSTQTFMGTLLLKVAAYAVSGLSVVAYLCQYVVLKSASNERSAIWIGMQGLMALIRISYWMYDPKFDDPKTEFAEYALINNTSFDSITSFELVCAVLPIGTTPIQVPGWALRYVLETPFRQILAQATGDERTRVPTGAETETYVFEHVEFERILRNRLGINEPPTGTDWMLGVWQHPSKPGITPFLLVRMLYDEIIDNGRLTHWGWMQISNEHDGRKSNDTAPEGWSIVEPETIFLMRAGRRVTITGYSDSSVVNADGTFQEHSTSHRFLVGLSRDVSDRLRTILDRPQGNAVSEPQALLPRGVAAYSHRLWIVATNGTIDRKYGRVRNGGQFLKPSQSGQLWDLEECLEVLRDYIEEPSSVHIVGGSRRKSAAEKRPAHTVSPA